MRVQPLQAHNQGWYFRLDVMNSSRSPNFEWTRLTLTIPRIAEVIYKVVERTNYILDTFSIEYTQQAFMHAYGIFHCMRSMHDDQIRE